MHAIRAGELLTEAKEQVRHGEWLPWLAANFPSTRQMASGYMRLFRHRDEMENAFSIRGALRERLEAADELADQAAGDPIAAVDLLDTLDQITARAGALRTLGLGAP